MRKLLGAILHWSYQRARTNRYITSLYYAVRSGQGFSNLNIQEWMLADSTRLDAYNAAIQRHIHPGQRVIDLGTGTGILSFLAARRRPERIYAIEHGAVIESAKAVARSNGITCIEFAKVNSRNFSIPEKVDVLLHEQIGNHCFEERMVENLIDLRDRLLKPGGRILPNRFRWFLEPAMVCALEEVPFVWEKTIHGVDFSCLKPQSDAAGAKYRTRLLAPCSIERILSHPEPAVVADIETMRLSDLPRTLTVRRTIQHAGRLDGFCAWFEAWFDEEISISSEPPHSRVHWRIPLYRIPAVQVSPGDVVAFHLHAQDLADPGTFQWTFQHTPAMRPEPQPV